MAYNHIEISFRLSGCQLDKRSEWKDYQNKRSILAICSINRPDG